MTEMFAKPGPALARRLTTADAVLVGLGAILGAGVFAAFGPAADAAGTGLLVGLAIAAVIAYCNAVASAQLAAVYPVSGGTYVYGRERLGPTWGFVAGWGFVVGKTASCAASAARWPVSVRCSSSSPVSAGPAWRWPAKGTCHGCSTLCIHGFGCRTMPRSPWRRS
jgi:amino acid transporter